MFIHYLRFTKIVSDKRKQMNLLSTGYSTVELIFFVYRKVLRWTKNSRTDVRPFNSFELKYHE